VLSHDLGGDDRGSPVRRSATVHVHHFATMLRRSRRDALAPDPSSPPAASPESALLERIGSGEEAAFEHLFRSYYQPLCDFAMSYVRSRETAEERSRPAATAPLTT
jgi:hypothetical protein